MDELLDASAALVSLVSPEKVQAVAARVRRTEANKALQITKLQAGGGEVRLFSALKKQGVDEVATTLYQWMHI